MVTAGPVKVEMPPGHRERLIKIAQQDCDINKMRFEEAKIDVIPGRGLEVTKRYKFQHVPYNRVYCWRSSNDPNDRDFNDEMLAEIALIEENL
jgi:hypothetical protein